MLQSSLGFHTMSLSLPLLEDEAKQLIMDFAMYGENTGFVQMYRKQEGDYISYRPAHDHLNYLPTDIKVYYSDGHYKGITWRVYCPAYQSGLMNYIVKVTINPKFLAGIHDYLTAATCSDMNIAITNFNEESKRISPLLGTFTDYKITRVDYCVNICLDDFIPGFDPERIVNLLKRGDIPPRYEEWMVYDEKAHRMKSKPESFYLKSKSVTINYYSKYMQLQNRSHENVEKGYKPVPPQLLDAARNIIRLEVQFKYFKIYTLSKKVEFAGDDDYNKYKALLSPLKCIEIASEYYERVIGRGDWYTLQEAVQIIKSKNYNRQKEKRLLDALFSVNQCRSLAKAKSSYHGYELDVFKRTLKELSSLGINPVTIPREWGIKRIPNLLQTYFTRAISEYYNFSDSQVDPCVPLGYSEYIETYGHAPI